MFYFVARVDDLMIIGSPMSCFVVCDYRTTTLSSIVFSWLSRNFELLVVLVACF